MDLNQLKTFVTVAETSSLTRAASLLFLSQPAVSAHIKSLESEFKVRLFNRNPRGMELTAGGIVMCDEARVALTAARNCIQKARSLNNVGTCTLGTISVPVILNLPGVLSELRQRHQNVNLTIRQNISGHIIDAVVSGEMDAGFVIGDFTEKNLGVMPILPITLCIVGPWAWRSKIQAAEWGDLQTFPWVSTPEKCSFSTITRQFFERNNATFTPSMVADQERTLTELVCLEMGLTLMREDLALTLQDCEQLCIWPEAKTVSQLCFIWARSRESSPVVMALIESVKALWKH
ncbi:LysR family transcriptional regulator [Winslowiella iniecta]|uniref:LysR family transcriptional regulator n=1 Tax=Winslowiella iniecta TaxID=1560201 RepID=A0A0L7T808_9GAMM|nr:LysR family transcriptional regulator [Winslowiella iniecta]KOC91508.1 LysR family transcriptional regulator [Winslowiella iniecta]KOC94541.1 LysR family transcriptional regulator [Winslowiella iniecta]